jgi:hypothetical protein
VSTETVLLITVCILLVADRYVQERINQNVTNYLKHHDAAIKEIHDYLDEQDEREEAR